MWLEAERLDELEGRGNDAQFIDQVGSPCVPTLGLGAPVTVHHAEGCRTVRVDQRVLPSIGGLFVLLGAYVLDASSMVVVANEATDGYVVVDAVQLVPVDPQE